MIEEVEVHVVVVRLVIRFGDRKIFIQVKSHDVFEAQLAVFVHFDQLPIDT